jgi:hypothetical protein
MKMIKGIWAKAESGAKHHLFWDSKSASPFSRCGGAFRGNAQLEEAEARRLRGEKVKNADLCRRCLGINSTVTVNLR